MEDFMKPEKKPRPCLISIDPSTSLTGYAVWSKPYVLEEAGLFKPAKPKAKAYDRVDSMLTDFLQLLHRRRPKKVIIELPSNVAGSGWRKGGRTSLIVYGAGAGAFYGACRAVLGGPATTRVLEIDWTHGTPKPARMMHLKAKYPSYQAAAHIDKGGDIGDAIGIGDWYFEQTRP